MHWSAQSTKYNMVHNKFHLTFWRIITLAYLHSSYDPVSSWFKSKLRYLFKNSVIFRCCWSSRWMKLCSPCAEMHFSTHNVSLWAWRGNPHKNIFRSSLSKWFPLNPKIVEIYRDVFNNVLSDITKISRMINITCSYYNKMCPCLTMLHGVASRSCSRKI